MPLAYLGLGTNLGDKEKNLENAIKQLSLHAGKVINCSTFHVTKPWNFESENTFLNAVVLLDTLLSPLKLLTKTQKIEKAMGRVTKTSIEYTDRIIDIDILLYDQITFIHPKLQIPHPHITNRDFVIRPLTEIAPNLTHPVTGKLFCDYLK